MQLRGGINIARHPYNIVVTTHAIKRFKRRFSHLLDECSNIEDTLKTMFCQGQPQRQDGRRLIVQFDEVRLVAVYPKGYYKIVTVTRTGNGLS